VSPIDPGRRLAQRLLHVETLDAQLDGQAPIAERLPVRLLQQLTESIRQAHRHVARGR
jgi:hypothetical protein